ncbi:unnamed protein product [Trichogramma brassicae]|uniref:Uncharacterized protein n=1 Tax=Trichogramma brassicae TaxID=86971 RepID=A0A6H5IEH2_9HYME|nr:unnamed protein product [Trichogramma brassicae]
MVVPTSNVDKTQKAGTNNGPTVAVSVPGPVCHFASPFADGLYEETRPRRPITDVFYMALTSISTSAYAIFVEPLEDTPYTIIMRTDRVVFAAKKWMLQLAAITLMALITWTVLPLVTAKIYKKWPFASVMLDVAVIMSGILYSLDQMSKNRFNQSTGLGLCGYGPAIVGLSLLPAIAFFKLAAGKRALAIAKMTFEAMDDLPICWLGIVPSSDYVAFGAWYWQRPRGFVTTAIINRYHKAVNQFNRGAMVTFNIVVAIGDSLFNTESGKRWQRFRTLMRDEPYIISCVQAYDLKTSAEMFEASQARRKGFIRSMNFESLIIQAMSWALFLRMSIMMFFFLIGSCYLLNYYDFFGDSESIFIVVSSCLLTHFYFYTYLLLRGARTIIECGKQDVELRHRELEQYKTTDMNEILVKSGAVSNC